MKKKKLLTFFYLFLSIIILGSCTNDDTITPILNTDEYFKYTLNNGPERVFDQSMTAYLVTNPSPNYQRFFFRASASTANGGSVYVDGDFLFQNYAAFTSTTTVPWGSNPTPPIVTSFYFTELFSADGFRFFPHNEYNSSPIDCTIVIHALNVGDYLEFTFTGNYTHISDPSITGTITGSGRMKRENDR